MPAMSETIGAVYEFGGFRLDAARRLSLRNDQKITLQPRDLSACSERRLLVNLPVESSSPITAALNWAATTGASR